MTQKEQAVDFDLHGIAGIRLLNASSSEVALVTRQVGPLQAELGREPDIVIEFVERLATVGPLQFIGLDDAAFDSESFIVLRGRHKTRVRVSLPLDMAGVGCRITCERGVPAIPMLVPLINLTALSHGTVPLHASAIVHDGLGVLATGWAKGGKTETLLSFMSHGATYVGDEWIYLRADGRMFGMPEPMKIWNWHLDELPEFRARVESGERLRLGLLRRAAAMAGFAASRRPLRGSAPGRLAARAGPLLRDQTYVHLPPHRLFGNDRCGISGSLDRIVLVVSRDEPGIAIEPVDGAEVAERMSFSNQHERQDLVTAYLKFRYAFPDRAGDFVERAADIERDLLRVALSDKPAYAVYHPYPMPIPALYEAIWPAIRRGHR
jgi:hypothetical protein